MFFGELYLLFFLRLEEEEGISSAGDSVGATTDIAASASASEFADGGAFVRGADTVVVCTLGASFDRTATRTAPCVGRGAACIADFLRGLGQTVQAGVDGPIDDSSPETRSPLVRPSEVPFVQEAEHPAGRP